MMILNRTKVQYAKYVLRCTGLFASLGKKDDDDIFFHLYIYLTYLVRYLWYPYLLHRKHIQKRHLTLMTFIFWDGRQQQKRRNDATTHHIL